MRSLIAGRAALLLAALPVMMAAQEPASANGAHIAPVGVIAPRDTASVTAMLQAPAPVSRSEHWHRVLGTTALFSFGTALVAGAASGNLGKLMDETACCPDGGKRNATWRTVDRALVDVGIVSYLGAAGLAVYRGATHASKANGSRKKVHTMLAMAHGLAFATSIVTGAMMGSAQDSDPAKFARLARIHTASNIAFVPLLAAAFTTMSVR